MPCFVLPYAPVLWLLLFLHCSLAATVYLSPNGKDTNSGTLNSAFGTLAKCVEAAGSFGTCYVKTGRYIATEEIITDAVGVTISATPGSTSPPQFEGAQKILATWTKRNDSIWSTSVTEIGFKPWQLFWSNTDTKGSQRNHVGLARWPDAQPWTDEGYDREKKWRHVGSGTDQGTTGTGIIADKETDGDLNDTLARTRISFENCVAVLNIGHWKTMSAIITTHKAGNKTFTFKNNFCGSSCPDRAYNDDHKGRYFIEGCVAALTTDNEWAYDTRKENILLRLPNGLKPSDVVMYGKSSTWAIVLNDCTNVTIRGLNFFATTIGIWKDTDATSGNTIRDCDFSYPVASRRSLHEVAEISPDQMTYYNASWYPKGSSVFKFAYGAPTFVASKNRCGTRATFYNNKFEYTDGNALYFAKSGDDVIDNNELLYIDYAAVGNAFAIDAMTSCGKIIYRRNTVDTVGASVGFRVGTGSALCELNYHTNMGLVQYDGATIQAGKEAIPGTIFRFNWIENTDKLGLRFDSGENANTFGVNGTMHHNVAVKALNGFQIKGFNHMISNNLGFQSTGDTAAEDFEDIAEGQERTDITIKRCWPCGLGYPASIYYCNNDTNVVNNAGGISGDGAGYVPVDWLTEAINPPLMHHNYNDNIEKTPVEYLLRDARNHDYRPRRMTALVDTGIVIQGLNSDFLGSAPDLGAYEFGADSYWIPGRQIMKASMPVPDDGTITAMPDADLMWLQALGASTHKVYFGLQQQTLSLMATFIGKKNIFTPQHFLSPGVTYYWRVDAVYDNDVIIPGDIWMVTAREIVSKTITAIADVYWQKSTPTVLNGHIGNLRLRMPSSIEKEIKAALQFNLGFQEMPLAAYIRMGCNLTITNAQLRLGIQENNITDVMLYKVDANEKWDEISITGPPQFEQMIAKKTNVRAGQILKFDVTTQANNKANQNSLLSFGLRTTDSRTNRKLNSRECTTTGCQKPSITMSITITCPTIPPTISPTITPTNAPTNGPITKIITSSMSPSSTPSTAPPTPVNTASINGMNFFGFNAILSIISVFMLRA